MKYRLAIVDFDGTLADSMPYWLELPIVTLREARIPEPEGFREYIRSIPLWEVGARLERDYPFLLEKGPVTEQWYEHMTENYRRRICLRPGALSLLHLLRREGLQVFLLSATRRGTLNAAMERFGLYSLLDRVYSEEEVGSKRSDEPYRRFARETGIAPEEMLIVEDAPANLRKAAELGLGTVAVQDPSMARWEAQLRRADVYLEDLSDLTALRAFLRRAEQEA